MTKTLKFHIDKLEGMKWNHYKQSLQFAEAMKAMSKETKAMMEISQRYEDFLSGKSHKRTADDDADLDNQAVDALEIKVKDGHLKEMVSIPSIEWVRLSFIPNNAFVESASKFTGRLLAKRCVQTRNLRKQHIDQHWVNAMTLYVLEWLVELKRLYDRVEFFGQDDKAKVAVGDAVPVSTGVRAKSRGIARAGEVDSPGLRAMDHDFHTANLIPSVTLRCNIPDIISGSFFSGGDDGFGQIFVTIHDAIFEPSKVYNHTAQLIDVIVKLEVAPAVLTLQTDCGGDHSIKRVATQLA